jgi:hypothetical protein
LGSARAPRIRSDRSPSLEAEIGSWTAAGSPAWGDYDNDGDLDGLISGTVGFGGVTAIFRNDNTPPNSPPRAPTGLQADASGDSVKLSWDPASDAQTPSAALTYNLRIGTSPGGLGVVPPMADPRTGRRLLPAMGNVQEGGVAALRRQPRRDGFDVRCAGVSGKPPASPEARLLGEPW